MDVGVETGAGVGVGVGVGIGVGVGVGVSSETGVGKGLGSAIGVETGVGSAFFIMPQPVRVSAAIVIQRSTEMIFLTFFLTFPFFVLYVLHRSSQTAILYSEPPILYIRCFYSLFN